MGRRAPQSTRSKRPACPDSDISIVANKYVSAEHADVDEVSGAAKGAGIGGALGGGAGLLAGLGLLAIPGLGPVVAAGWLAATAAGAAAGAATGGIVGALVDAGVNREHADVYSESIRRGGTMVTARVRDEEAAARRGDDGDLQAGRPRGPRRGVSQDWLVDLRRQGAAVPAEPGRNRPHTGQLAGLTSAPREDDGRVALNGLLALSRFG